MICEGICVIRAEKFSVGVKVHDVTRYYPNRVPLAQ